MSERDKQTFKKSKDMKNQLQETLNQMAGCHLEVTVRNEKAFTFSFEGKSSKPEMAVKNLFKDGKIESEYDEELNETFIYVDLK